MNEASKGKEVRGDTARRRSKVLFIGAGVLLIVGLVVAAMLLKIFPFNQDASGAQSTESPTGSSAVPALSDNDLWAPADLTGIGGAGTWFISQTLGELSASSTPPACLTAVTGTVKPATSRQRTLTADQAPELAALHQLDRYENASDATTVFDQRAAKLAACDDSPAYIVSSSSVTGIGDAALQMTVSYQAATTHYHTLLMVRSGTLISIFDVANNATTVTAQDIVKAATATLGRSCSASNGTCPTEVKVADGVPPTAPPAGWLIPSDLPRMSPDTGRWTATEPSPLKPARSGCENLTLTSVTGPTDRKQRTYLLSEDPKRPQDFGADEMLFTFPDENAAAAFAKTLSDNVSSCAQRLATAEVSRGEPIRTTSGQVQVTGNTFTVVQSLTPDNKVVFQIALLTAGNKVSYVFVNTIPDFQVGSDQFRHIAIRAGQRAAQLP